VRKPDVGSGIWRWDETEGPPFTLELCESELRIRAYLIRQMLACGFDMNLVDLAECRAVANKLLVFAIAWVDRHLESEDLDSVGAIPTLELCVRRLVEIKNELARPNLGARQFAEGLDSGAALLHEAQKAWNERVGPLPN
jgi:FtsZ-binding cell division protein ZapB